MPALTGCKRALCPEASEQIRDECDKPDNGANHHSGRGSFAACSAGREAANGDAAPAGRSRNTDAKKASRRTAPPPPSSTQPVACPRCGSEATKFCYYNNYDPQQPRYYCKDCQRYWTVGGVLRNVPPGSGRRKSRSAASREHRKAASSLVSSEKAPTSEGQPGTATLPSDLMQSNPLASMLMSNLGLGGTSVPLSVPGCRLPVDAVSTDFSNQTATTMQRLPVAPSLLSASAGVTPALVTPSLLARFQTPVDTQSVPQQAAFAPPQQQHALPTDATEQKAAPPQLSSLPSQSAFTQHTRSSAGPSRSTESQAGAFQDASTALQPNRQGLTSQQEPQLQKAMPTAGLSSHTGMPSRNSTPAPAQPASQQRTSAGKPLTAAAIPLLGGLNSGPPPADTGKVPQLPGGLLLPMQSQSQQALQMQSQLLANMAMLPASAQIMLAQNAAWLAAQTGAPAPGMGFSPQQGSFSPSSFGTSFASSASIAPNGQSARSGSSGSDHAGPTKSGQTGVTSGGPPTSSTNPSSAFVPPILPLCTAAPTASTVPHLQWPLPTSSPFLSVQSSAAPPTPALWTSLLPAQNGNAAAPPQPPVSSLPNPPGTADTAPVVLPTAGTSALRGP